MSYFRWITRWFSDTNPVNETTGDISLEAKAERPSSLYRRIGGLILVVIGYLLSPLCWWNDIVFNLPLAVGFGYLSSRIYPDAFVVLTVVGYWLSNVVGFVMMQQGAVAALQHEAQPQNPRKAFINGMLTSTAYTLLIVGLLQLHLVEMPDMFSSEMWSQLDSMLPSWWSGT